MIQDKFQLTDKVAVVTGAGRGIGAASAVALAESGADVVISARTEDQLREVAKHIENAGRRAHIVTADLFDLDAAAGLAEAAKSEFGRSWTPRRASWKRRSASMCRPRTR